jgi:hypothetical protein
MTTAQTNPILFELSRNPFGQLELRTADGHVHVGVLPVRAFPIQSPDDGISLVQVDGHEVIWIDALAGLPAKEQALVREELQSREFMPEIQRIARVSSFSTPCTWHVSTDRGDTQFVLRGSEDIRRVGQGALLVTDSHGIQFLIRDQARLDKEGRRILDRFM